MSQPPRIPKQWIDPDWCGSGCGGCGEDCGSWECKYTTRELIKMRRKLSKIERSNGTWRPQEKQ